MKLTVTVVIALMISTWIPSGHGEGVAPVVRIGLANPVLIVKDLEASTRFYTQIMGYQVTHDGEIEAEVSKRTVGANRKQKTRAVYLRSSPLNDRDLPASSIALVYIDDDSLPEMQRGDDPDDAVQGEIMLSLVVEGLQELLRRMEAGGYTVLNGLQPSSSGKSLIASALDPNGIRLEMYEYL